MPRRFFTLLLSLLLMVGLTGTPAVAQSPQHATPLPGLSDALLEEAAPLAVPSIGSSASANAEIAAVLASAMQVAAGEHHTCAVTHEGGLRCWGLNGNGQLGDASTTNRSTPVDVGGLTNGVATVAAGTLHTCAVTTSGGVKCWGWNTGGQLGDGSSASRSTPVDVSGLVSGVAAVAAGYQHTCALTGVGGVKCWGRNNFGQLGDGTTEVRFTPVDVSGLTSGVLAVAAGDWHTCAVTSGGRVKCWGANDYRQLGDGTTTARSMPVDVGGLTNGVAMVAAGLTHTCAVTASGGVRCWGMNEYAPVDVSGLTSGVAAVTASARHNCALTTSGGVKCWGNNDYRQLGDGTATGRSTPVDVSGLTSGVSAVAAGGYHTCAVTTSGRVKCWGRDDFGQLGDGDGSTTVRSRRTPVDVGGLGSVVRAVAAGYGHTCVLTSAGGVKCWGSNNFGQLGDGTTTDRYTPVDVNGLTSGVLAVAAGGAHTCALTGEGGVKCWGRNDRGQLGDRTTEVRYTPVDVSGLASGVAAVAVGEHHTCAVTSAGALKCWGYNYSGQLGDDTTTDRSKPVDVSGLTRGVQAVAAGAKHTCAVTRAGGVKCWGENNSGQLGDGSWASRSTPVDVRGLASGVAAVAAAAWHTCALTSAGGVKCWGYNDVGELGDGTTDWHTTPVDVRGLASSVAAVAAGNDHTCALMSADALSCWGWNGDGQLGDGTTQWRSAPVDVNGLSSDVAALAAGGKHTCAVTGGGGVKCWGWNEYGQLGLDPGWTPVDVVGFGGSYTTYLPLLLQ